MKKTLTAGCVLFFLLLTAFFSAQATDKTTIFKARCVGCGDCVRACPVQAITLVRGKAVVDVEKCIGCKLCVITCSYGAPR